MQVLFIVLNDLSFQQDILEIFIQCKVRGATILDSEGMAKAVLEAEGFGMLLSGIFGQTIPKTPKGSKTIFTVIQDPDVLPKLVSAIQNKLESSTEQTIGFMFSLPVSGIYPLKTKKQ